uniref:Uncharacterized protein n=1 Tax=viral metagenome TaxID=1070528 RepID=A0A6C0DLP5_9ZZZZ
MYKMMFSINNINNGTLSAGKAMPQKDITSDNNSSFELARKTYIETYTGENNVTRLKNDKKWYGNRDASQVTSNRRNNQVGVGSLNASKQQMSFTNHKDVNVVNDALRRVRGGGAVAPAKKGANRNNAPTPGFRAKVKEPRNNLTGYVVPTIFH